MVLHVNEDFYRPKLEISFCCSTPALLWCPQLREDGQILFSADPLIACLPPWLPYDLHRPQASECLPYLSMAGIEAYSTMCFQEAIAADSFTEKKSVVDAEMSSGRCSVMHERSFCAMYTPSHSSAQNMLPATHIKMPHETLLLQSLHSENKYHPRNLDLRGCSDKHLLCTSQEL